MEHHPESGLQVLHTSLASRVPDKGYNVAVKGAEGDAHQLVGWRAAGHAPQQQRCPAVRSSQLAPLSAHHICADPPVHYILHRELISYPEI